MSVNSTLNIVELDTFTGPSSPDIVVNSITLNKIYYIPLLDALWLCFKANITTTRYGYQCGMIMGDKASEFFGGYY